MGRLISSRRCVTVCQYTIFLLTAEVFEQIFLRFAIKIGKFMSLPSKNTFVIPTYRLKEVADTVAVYDENFWKNGHSIDMTVFDDSNQSMSNKFLHRLEEIKTHNKVYYVGPKEKAQFFDILSKRITDWKIMSIVKNLFRPSYGGNRNFTLMYTLGELMITSDDDMRPYAYVGNYSESLSENEICHGVLLKSEDKNMHRKEYDILGSFDEVLGKKRREIPDHYLIGDHLVDSAMNLETNTTKGLTRENSLHLIAGEIAENAMIKIAQTFRSGTNDIDALDYVSLFLEDDKSIDPNSLNDVYVLNNFRPVLTNKNWRIDCGVAGFDNRLGLPPFFPTRLRFEDYIYRLWVQQDNIASAHVTSGQHHMKSNYMRSPLASEIFNEEICSLLKVKIKESISHMDNYSIKFDYDGNISEDDVNSIFERLLPFKSRIIQAEKEAKTKERKEAIKNFAISFDRAFYDFERDFFLQNVSRIIEDVVSETKACLELWPTLIEICYLEKIRNGLPKRLIGVN